MVYGKTVCKGLFSDGIYICGMHFNWSVVSETEFVPSMLLGVPQEGTATSVLPGHRMVLQGRSKEVIRIVAIGGFGAIVITILMMSVFAITLPFLHELTKPYTWIILLSASVYLTYALTNSKRDFAWSLHLMKLESEK